MQARTENNISVATKPQLKEARNADDDWTGIASAKERRKLQNKLHQRAWRRRKIQESIRANTPYSIPTPHVEDARLDAAFAAASAIIPQPKNSGPQHLHLLPARPSTTTPVTSLDLHPSVPTKPFTLQTLKDLHVRTRSPRKAQLIPPVISYINPSSSTPHVSAYPSFHFPLAPDHYLITLIQYNVLRAVMTNFLLVNLDLPPECQNAFRIPLLHHPPSSPPPTFAPTSVQRSIRHEAWIDSVPCPRFRDNLIHASTDAGGRFDDEDLCDDVCGGLYEGFDECETRGLLVWGDPWLVESWEISPGFAAKWGMLLRGCGEMMVYTNRWREARGEEPIALEID
ncbi:hypothetical protein N0V90_004991 [Kalmusia sp. IMI 367209]|nr:hypothetical protein N0V90_004991 [Kalmusia sp. IMI 367209]